MSNYFSFTLVESKYMIMNLTASLIKAEFNGCRTVLVPFWGRNANISNNVDTVLIFTTIVLPITMPFTVLLNLLVMAAVKSTRRLQTKSNILLACLAGTDFTVGLILQPLFVTMEINVLRGIDVNKFCTLERITGKMFDILCGASLFQLVFISLERYLAIKHTFFYSNYISAKRLIIASAIAWTLLLILTILEFHGIHLEVPVLALGIDDFLIILSVPVIIIFHAIVYIEVRRHEHQISWQQISLEARLNFTKEKKALKTTTLIIIAVFLCYFPSIILIATPMLDLLEKDIGGKVAFVALFVAITLTLLNSLINPLIYAARSRQFRVAFVQLLCRKRLEQAGQIEMRVFRPANMAL